MDEHDGPAHLAAAKDDLVFRERLAKGCERRPGALLPAAP
jgi:hypothetical protein